MTETFVHHCETVYKALEERATTKDLESGGQALVFVGSYVEVWKSTKISQTYYSPIKKALERHEAIVFLQRGGRDADTVIVLRGLPEVWEIDGWQGKGSPGGLTTARGYAKLAAEVDEIRTSLGGMNVVEAFVEFEKRVVALESELQELSTKYEALKEDNHLTVT